MFGIGFKWKNYEINDVYCPSDKRRANRKLCLTVTFQYNGHIQIVSIFHAQFRTKFDFFNRFKFEIRKTIFFL